MDPKTKNTSPVRDIALPEALEKQLNQQLSKSAIKDMAEAFEKSQRERFEKRLADRVKSYKENVAEKGSTARQILARKLLIKQMKAEQAEIRASIKLLRDECKALRPKRVKKEKKVVAVAS